MLQAKAVFLKIKIFARRECRFAQQKYLECGILACTFENNQLEAISKMALVLKPMAEG
ncbi:MAG: hypothetical protein KDD14_13310 [Saprospiraceae bacterium]|nr:hypothetical protein [Saprospiraceae bacterium]